jgi:hypothetical protein
MLSLVDTLMVLAVAALLLAAEATSSLYLRKIISRLNSNHHVLWLKMGCPSRWYLALGRDSSPDIGTQRINLALWLYNEEYVALNDADITRMARRRAFLDRVGLALMALLGGYGVLRYYGLLNTIGPLV